MRTTIYKCDKCGIENISNNDLQLKEIKVFVEGDSSYAPTCRVDWCLKCRKDTGLQAIWDGGVLQKAATPLTHGETLEEIIREIAREEISDGNVS